MFAPAPPLPVADSFPVDTLLRPADLEAYAREMPLATTVLPRLQSLLHAETASIGDIVDLVMLDPGLALRLIQATAGPRHGHRLPAVDLASALLQLGAEEIYRVTATYTLGRLLNRSLRCYGISPTEFWRRSVACALAMADLAPAGGLDTRTAYTVGLLHAVGMIFIDRHLRCVGAPQLRFGPLPPERLPRAEVMLTGMHHARAAAFVLRAWGFGEEIAEPVEHQLRPGGSLRHRAMTSLLAEACALALELVPQLPPPGDDPTESASPVIGDAWQAALAEQVLRLETPPV
jgi:HD-like signal output (HDOD) protein